MTRARSLPSLLAALAVAGLASQMACAPPSTPETGNRTPATPAGTAGPRSSRYGDLVTLFGEWRTFQRPKSFNGVPDYSAAAMATQYKELAGYKARLAAIETVRGPLRMASLGSRSMMSSSPVTPA